MRYGHTQSASPICHLPESHRRYTLVQTPNALLLENISCYLDSRNLRASALVSCDFNSLHECAETHGRVCVGLCLFLSLSHKDHSRKDTYTPDTVTDK